jgi:vitamin B12 transporter
VLSYRSSTGGEASEGFLLIVLFMKSRTNSAQFAALPLALALAAAFPSFAQSNPPQLKETFVTANRTAQPIGDVVADVTVIDRDVIERSGAAGIADVLARVPGIEIVRNGGVGSATSVFTRGGESRHTVVLIDGVRVDSQSTSGGANWQAIPLAQVDRIEIVRGPTSAVYGSDAAAGVIQIFTKKGQGAFTPAITLGYGAYNTQKLDMSASGSTGAVDYLFGIAQASSDGFNIRPIAGQNPDIDGYKSLNVNFKLGFQVNADHRLETSMLNNRNDAQYDSGLTRDYRRVNTLQTISAQWLAKWTDNYSTRVSVSEGIDRGEDALVGLTPILSFDQTKINSLLWANEYRLGAHLFSATLENRQDQFVIGGSVAVPAGSISVNRDKFQNSFGLGYGWTGSTHTVQLNLRRDSDSEFGGKSTGSAAYAFALTPQLKISASAGTSFRVPTLYQRFTIYAPTEALLPEAGSNVELGVRYTEGARSYGVVAYRNKMKNLLSFVTGNGTCTNGKAPVLLANRGCYANTASAEFTGFTFTASETIGNYRVYGSMDLQNPRNTTSNKQLPRRAMEHATLGVDTRLGAWTLAGDVLFSARRFDNVENTTELPGYSLINLSASTSLAKDWKALVRVDNLSDKIYQTASGFATARRTLYVGLTWAPQ